MKKAVSPLIAVILLIVFTIAVSTAILGWLTTYTKTTTEAASSGTTGTSGVVNCANQMISISDVSITQNSDTVTQFNDSDTSKTFSSAAGITETVWVRIPVNATVTSTALTITGQAYD
ncbi:hypothetical protein GQ473_05040 [archaeon]|nr:hypothetical protein [archaeon]